MHNGGGHASLLLKFQLNSPAKKDPLDSLSNDPASTHFVSSSNHLYLLTLSACAEGYSNQNVCLSVCLSLAGSWRRHYYDTQNKHQCQANYVLFILKKLISV